MKVTAAIALVGVAIFTAGCVHHQGFTVPTVPKTLALFQQDLAAAQRHDGKALCATAEYPEQCQHDVAAQRWPKLTGVHTGAVRVVDTSRVVRVCGQANGQPFASDFPVTREPKGRLGAINPVFWIPMTFIPVPSQGAPVSPPTSPPSVVC